MGGRCQQNGWREKELMQPAIVDAPEQHHHRHWSDIRKLLESSSLPNRVKTRSLAVFETLAIAEGKARDPGRRCALSRSWGPRRDRRHRRIMCSVRIARH